MGNDGGSVPVRREQVKLKKKEKPVISTEKDRAKHLTCAISHESLFGKQVVCDRLGNVFDKLAVIKGMVEKSLPASFTHLKSMKDLIHIEFTINEDYKNVQEAQAGSTTEGFVSPFICPITSWPVNGKHKFCALTTCGHVFSAKGINGSSEKEGEKVKNCYVCQSIYTDDDIITLNPNDEEKQIMNDKMIEFSQKQKENKRKLKEKIESQSNQNSKKRKVAPAEKTTNGDLRSVKSTGLVQGGLVAKAALKLASEEHDTQKRASTIYQSIFSSNEKKNTSLTYVTGIYMK